MALDEGYGRQPTASDLKRKKEEKLYNLVKQGKVRLQDLNDDGLKALESHLGHKNDAYSKKTDQEARSRRAAAANEAALSSREEPKKSNWFVDSQKKIYDTVFKPVEEKVWRFSTSAADELTLGQGKKLSDQIPDSHPAKQIDPFRKALQAPTTTADKVADLAGSLYGLAAPIGAAYKTTGKLGEGAFKALTKGKDLGKSGKYLEDAAKGAGAMLGYETAKEGIDEMINPENKTFGERLQNVGIGTAVGAVGDPLARLAGGGILKLVDRLKKPPVTERNATKILDAVETLKKKPAAEMPLTAEMPAEQALQDAIGMDLPSPLDADYIAKMEAHVANKPKYANNSAGIALNSMSKNVQKTGDIAYLSKVEDRLINMAKEGEINKNESAWLSGLINIKRERLNNMKTYTKEFVGGNVKNDALSAKNLIDNQKQKIDDAKHFNRKIAEEALANSDYWVDKSKPLMKRETMDRNFEDIMGQDAPMMKRLYLEPVKESEAARVRFVKEMKDWAKSIGVKPGSQEDQLIQKYGEKKISLAELKDMAPKNWQQIEDWATEFRSRYDQFHDAISKVLEGNGLKSAGYIEDYFPHYTSSDSLLKKLGFDTTDNKLPTDISGLTADFKPQRQFSPFLLKRKGDETTFGALEGFERYVDNMSNVIYHSPNIQKLRALEDAIRGKYGENADTREGATKLSNFITELRDYTNVLAGKKSDLDRGAESGLGRIVYNIIDTAAQKTGANMIGGNISSALTAFIPMTQVLATTPRKRLIVKAMMDTLRSLKKDDGFVDASDFLTRRIGTKKIVPTFTEKVVDKSMMPMQLIDNFTSQVITRAKYAEGLTQGMDDKAAMKYANDWAAKIMADRSKGSMPTLFASRFFKPFTQFQLEVNNQLSVITKDLPRNFKGKQLASALTQLAVYGWVFNSIFEQLTGRRPALDPIGYALEFADDLTDEDKTAVEASENLGKSLQGQVPFGSTLDMFGLGLGSENSSRLPVQSVIPHPFKVAKGEQSFQQGVAKPLSNLIFPAGASQFWKGYDAVTNFGLNPLEPQAIAGKYNDSGNLQYPIEPTPRNILQNAVFGTGSLAANQEYYDKNRRVLSEGQTKQVEKSPDPLKAYEGIMNKRKIDTLQNKINAIKKDRGMSVQQKKDKIAELIEQLKNQRQK